MASRGRGRRDRPRGTGQAPSAFDKQAFSEAVGIAAAAIVQAGAAGSQGGIEQGRKIHLLPTGKETEDFCYARTSKTGPRLSGPRPGWDI